MLRNNTHSLLTHVALMFLSFAALNEYPSKTLCVVFIVISVLAYVTLGYFLKPQETTWKSLQSVGVISLLGLGTFVMIFIVKKFSIYYLYYFHLYALLLVYKVEQLMLLLVLVFLPTLLIYAGMRLRVRLGR